MSDQIACETCAYFVARDRVPRNKDLLPSEFGECRRRAPSGMQLQTYSGKPDDDGTMYRMIYLTYPFPPVAPEDWCGEYFGKAE